MTKIEMTEILKTVRVIGDSAEADYTDDGHYILAQALLAAGNIGLIAKSLSVAHNTGASGAANKIGRACSVITAKANAWTDLEVDE